MSVVPDPVELLRDLLRFDTTNPPGAERECIEHVRGLLSAAGVESELYARDPERTNLVARLPGSNGSVGMYGFSYPGATQLLAASLRPPSLAAIAPGFTSSQFYEGWAYEGGAFSLASMSGWASFLAVDAARRSGDDEAHAALLAALGDGAHAMPDFEADVPQERHQLLDRGVAGGVGWLRHEQQYVDVGSGVQLAAAIAADRHQRPCVASEAVGAPRLAQHGVDQRGTRMHQLLDRFFREKA